MIPIKRLITALFLIAITITGITLGDLLLWLIISIASILCLHEINTMKTIKSNSITYISSISILVIFLILLRFPVFHDLWNTSFMVGLFILTLCLCIIEFIRKTIFKPKATWVIGLFNTAIIITTLPYAYIIRNSEFGFEKILLILLTISIIDTSAYFTGKIIGRRKLSKLSPNKTIEGLIGGITTGLITGLLGIWVFNLPYFENILLIISILIIAPLGDLYESMIKRNCNCKDSSNLLPGHGGVFDRIDSHIFCFPVIYFISKIISL